MKSHPQRCATMEEKSAAPRARAKERSWDVCAPVPELPTSIPVKFSLGGSVPIFPCSAEKGNDLASPIAAGTGSSIPKIRADVFLVKDMGEKVHGDICQLVIRKTNG